MLGRREIVDGKPGKYVWMTYKEAYDIVTKVGASIRSLGVEQGGRCGIYGSNCPEWIISMEACNAHGIYCVPLYDTLGAGAVEFILCHAEVQIAFAEAKKIGEVLKTLPRSSKFLKTIVSFGKVTPEQRDEVEKSGLAIYSWDEFLLLVIDNKAMKRVTETSKCLTETCAGTFVSLPNDLSMLGTVGPPVPNVDVRLESVPEMNYDALSEVPRGEICVRGNTLFSGYYKREDLTKEVMIDGWFHTGDIGEWQPDGSMKIIDRKKNIFKLSQGEYVAVENLENVYGLVPDVDSVKDGLGGRVRLILSGAAPLAIHVEEFLRVVTCAHVLQGYGLTETCAGTFVSLPNDLSMLGTVGPPVPNVDVRLESVPEMNYDALSEVPRGEICVRGNTLFSGYYKREDLTKEVMIDGWFHTGDIGEWQPDGSMKIIDRKKNIFKLSQGEYVAVENLENVYGLVPDVDSVCHIAHKLLLEERILLFMIHLKKDMPPP
ncbi:putative Long chain acyl-CoA synthetase 3 [Cocos nucifera]|uniref:Putative Long chain acyl-CoA synthetase 3 n=1 Tax=Cocos nucifera TaxID=13894 RepID=A0A8K0IU88_COCNU|nr:putative Long chain acyl-CoA synthetase 3 [Cocos nucifera]